MQPLALSDGTLTARRLAQVLIKLRYNANKSADQALFVWRTFIRQYPKIADVNIN